MENAKIKSWEVSDAFWERVRPLIPTTRRDSRKKFERRSGGGRKPLDPRKVFEGIVFVLRTGVQWKALPKERFGCPGSVHRYFSEWERAGFFLKIWKRGLHEFDEMEGIAWEWQSGDGSMGKSPMGKESVGPNPTDRGEKWSQKESARRRAWNPPLDRRLRGEHP